MLKMNISIVHENYYQNMKAQMQIFGVFKLANKKLVKYYIFLMSKLHHNNVFLFV